MQGFAGQGLPGVDGGGVSVLPDPGTSDGCRGVVDVPVKGEIRLEVLNNFPGEVGFRGFVADGQWRACGWFVIENNPWNLVYFAQLGAGGQKTLHEVGVGGAVAVRNDFSTMIGIGNGRNGEVTIRGLE